MSDFCQILKKETPKTFEDFRVNYLRNKYEFWNKKVGKEKLYFCGRDFLSQAGYFLDWLRTAHNITATNWQSEDQIKEFIKDKFKLLEDKFWYGGKKISPLGNEIHLHYLRNVKFDLLDQFINDVEAAVASGKIKSEKQAMKFAKKYLVEDYPCYAPNLSVTQFLPHTIKEVFQEKEYKHPWFKGKTKSVVYVDIWGRVWSKATGVILPHVQTHKILDDYSINELGGSVWRSPDNINFTCEYRTQKKEMEEVGAKPETFIG